MITKFDDKAFRVLFVLVFVLGLVGVPGTGVKAQGDIQLDSLPVGWVQNPANNHYYRLTGNLTWQDAEAQAMNFGGHLVTVNDQAETDWLVSTFGGDQTFWIGYTDQYQEGDWVWASGETTGYTNWFQHLCGDWEPNDVGPNGEDYVGFNYNGDSVGCDTVPVGSPEIGPGKWNDLPITVTIQGIIESPNTPYVPSPIAVAFLFNNGVEGFHWPLDAQVTLTVDDPDNGTGVDYSEIQTSVVGVNDPWDPTQTNVRFQLAGFTLQPGQILVMTDGATTKTHIVTSLTLGGGREDNNTVWGTAEPDAVINVTKQTNHNIFRNVTADSQGNWLADFSVPGDEQGEDPYDIQLGDVMMVIQNDNDGDHTQIDWRVPNPRFSVQFPWNEIHGYEWPLGASISLTIDDPSNGNGVDYSQTKTVDTENFRPPFDTWIGFRLGEFTVKPGDIVTMTDGNTIKTHITQEIAVTNVDPLADTVSGTALAGTDVGFGGVCDNTGCVYRNVPVDVNGNWLVDFSVPGDQDNEQQTFDLRAGSSGEAQRIDDDGDGTVYQWRVPNPTFGVRANDNNIEGWEWPLGSTVAIEIDDPNTGTNPDYTGTAPVVVADWDPTQTSFRHNIENYDLKTGDVVKVTEGNTIKQLTVTDFIITDVNLDTDTVLGTAGPNQYVRIWTCWQNTPCVNRDETADQNGHWVTNFAVPGEQDWESETADLRAGSWIDSSITDEDGDQVMFGWSVPNPRIEVMEYVDRIALVDWPAGQNVHVSIGNAYEMDFTPDQDWSYYEFFANYDIKTGDVITATNGTLTKTLQVAMLQATEIDANNGIVQGVAAPNSQFDVDVWGDQFNVLPEHDVVSVDGDGNWSADYSNVPGNTLPWEWLIRGEMRQSDDDGDVTLVNWHRHWSVLEVWMNEAELHAFDWEVGATLTFTVDDPTTYQPVDFIEEAQATPLWWLGHGAATVSVAGKINLRPGMTVTVTDGTITKSTVIQNIGFTKLDPNNDVMEGFAPANTSLDMVINQDYFSNRYFSANSAGEWMVDYKTPDLGGRTLDLRPGDQFQGLYIRDDEFDSTVVSGHVPNPSLSARLKENEVHGYDWMLGSAVTLFVDGTMVGTQTVVQADWDPNQTFVRFQLGDSVTLHAGQVVEMTDGIMTKTHTVTNLAVTGVNANNDTVFGTADSGTQVDIGHIYCDNNGCYGYRREVADSNGNWLANFSVVGEDSDEQDIIDIKPGVGSEARQCDDDGDCTQYGWYVPNDTLHAVPTHPEVHGHDWPIGAEVTLTIDNDTNPNNGVLYTRTKNADDDPWCGYPCFDLAGVFNLQVGQYVSMTDGMVTKTVHVSVLKITEVDYEHDTLRGVADPGSRVAVNIWSQNGLARYVTTGDNGIWVADFSTYGDEDFEQFTTDITADDNGRAIQLNPDGTDDGTLEYWPIMSNQAPDANAGLDQIVFAGNTVTLDASASSDPEAGSLTYEWDLDNDGQYDDASGVTVTTSFNQPGAHVIGLLVTDDGGLTDTDTVTVTVLAWTLKGFYQPVDMNGVYNTVKGGSTVPLKFEVFAGTTEITNVADIKGITYAQMACNANALTDEIETTSTGGTSLRYADGQFIYNWKTPKTAGLCYRVTMTTLDGSSLIAYFKMK